MSLEADPPPIEMTPLQTHLTTAALPDTLTVASVIPQSEDQLIHAPVPNLQRL